MQIDGIDLAGGNFYLWKVPRQNVQGADLYSVYFKTDDDKIYEVVFARPTDANPVSGWYLAEKPVLPVSEKPDEILEGEIVETPVVNDSNTLSVSVSDELILGEEIH